MSSTAVSVLVPLLGQSAELPSTLEAIEQYLHTTGFEFEVRVLDTRAGNGLGAMLRRGVSEAKGSIIVVVDPELPYPVAAIGDAVALIDSAACDVVFACRRDQETGYALARTLLAPILPDPAIYLKAFSADAARLLFNEAKLAGGGFDLEIAYLANKYGLRIERLNVAVTRELQPKRTFGSISLIPIIAIRMTDRRMGYRAPRRCPVCFSHEVWSWSQIPANVIRACSRCKCRYLNNLPDVDETQPVRRVLRAHPSAMSADASEEERSDSAREKTSLRRLATVRGQLTSHARVLEIGVRDGSFGAAAAREFEYVGIDPATAAARAARSRGLEVYCSTLASFVNTGPAFDAITLFHVFENMSEPHDALARIKDLLKPGGAFFLTTFDTEGLLFMMADSKRVARNFRTHRILYSRSALIELLEHSGFEIVSVGPDFEYRDQKFVRHRIASRWPRLASLANALLRFLPDPLLVSSGSIRILARRRAGSPTNMRAIRSVEPTHAR